MCGETYLLILADVKQMVGSGLRYLSATTEIYRNNSITKFYKKLKMFFFDISNSTQHLSQWQPPDTSAETLSVTRLYKLPSLSTWIILFL